MNGSGQLRSSSWSRGAGQSIPVGLGSKAMEGQAEEFGPDS